MPTQNQLKAIEASQISFDLPHHVGRGMDAFFERWDDDPNGHPTRLPVSDVWDRDGLHVRSTNFNAYDTGPIVSRLTKRWPVFATDIKLPTLEAGVFWKLAFETGHQGTAGDITFKPGGDGTWMEFRAHTREGVISLNITSLLPNNYDTSERAYRLFRYRGGAWLTIGNELKAVILNGVPEGLPTWEDNPPYALGSLGAGENMGSEFGFKTRAWSDTQKEFTFPLTTEEECFGMFEGQELPPKQFPIYDENSSTKWAGNSFSGVARQSHPTPLWGYEHKTLLLQSDSATPFEIQVYAGGGWRTWFSDTLTANELYVYNFNGQVPIARVQITPTNSDAIAVAEWNLS